MWTHFCTSHFKTCLDGVCHVCKRTWNVGTLRCNDSCGVFIGLYHGYVARSLYHIGDSFVLTVSQRTVIDCLNSHDETAGNLFFDDGANLCALHSPHGVRVRYVVFLFDPLGKDIPVCHYFFLFVGWNSEDNLAIAGYCIV